MIDLHTHILPGIDDGSPDIETSVAMARLSAEEGISVMVATPHVNGRYAPTPAAIRQGVADLNEVLAAEHIPVVVSPGAEIAISEVSNLEDEALAALSLGGSTTLLIESPYLRGVPFFDSMLFEIQSRGFKILLAHPERSPMFQQDPEALHDLVERGVLCSITAGSMRGRFGRRVARCALDFISLGLVHNVSSDAHGLRKRPPGLVSGFEGARELMPALETALPWFTTDVPGAILSNAEVPPAPIKTGNLEERRGIRRLLGL
jgi:protein-tyrosine phosphatase